MLSMAGPNVINWVYFSSDTPNSSGHIGMDTHLNLKIVSVSLTPLILFSTNSALAQCSIGMACGVPLGSNPIDRIDRPGHLSVVTAAEVVVEIPITTSGATNNTITAATAGFSDRGTTSILPAEHRSTRDHHGLAAATGPAMLHLQSSILDQSERVSLSDNASYTNLWNAEGISYRNDRTVGACSLNRQGPQINTCR